VPQIVVRDGRSAGALAAEVVFGSPGAGLVLVGVTGTNGKTTTTALVRHLLGLRGPAASLGTLGLVDPDGRPREGSVGLTTPGPVQLSSWLRELVDAGVASVSLEASSHALDQRRLDGLRFQAAVFTNLSRDHLDYHGTMEAYRGAKLRLLELVADDGTVIVNAADPAWQGVGATRLVRFRVEDAAAGAPAAVPPVEVVARQLHTDAGGSRFTLHAAGASVPVRLPLPGRFNVENATAAAAVGLVRGLSLAEVAEGLASAPPVPGRLEVVVRDPFTVIIDFAHTPAALDRVLETVRSLAAGRLVVVFGAGGDRDRSKRRPMARAVARWADRVWLTSDNPRTEDAGQILDDLAAGLGGVSVQRQVDRRRAIHGAVAEAEAGDVVVLAGKGHETHQVVGEERFPFDERDVVAEAMAARGAE
jgi:UDP-N-acetylmuramoyl-L-alanyl-D-glutamate--2,6-diaminopimelate ligase